jgi:hypothetical protein
MFSSLLCLHEFQGWESFLEILPNLTAFHLRKYSYGGPSSSFSSSFLFNSFPKVIIILSLVVVLATTYADIVADALQFLFLWFWG